MDKEKVAIMRLQEASKMSLTIYQKPLIVTTSGGKDSSVCLELAQRSGIPFEVMHNHTTADAPETVYFVRNDLRRFEGKGITCILNYPVYKGKQTSMWGLIPQKLMPPTRLKRYCCDVLKEGSGKGRFIATGVRWAESAKRAANRGILEIPRKDKEKKIILNNDNDESRRWFESCALKAKRICNPIVDWSDDDVWDYIQSEHITVNPLYQNGFTRVGCIGCPMAGKKADNLSFPDTQSSKICIFGHLKECSRSVFDGVGCKEAGELEPPEGIYITGGWRMVSSRDSLPLKISSMI